MRTHGSLASAGILLLAGGLVAGCLPPVGAATQTADPVPSPSSSSDSSAVASDAADCYVERVPEESGRPRSIAELHDVGVVAFLGTFKGEDAARWNTPDGQRPTRDELQRSSAILVRPVTFDVTKSLVGDPDRKTLIIRGGTLGCDDIAFPDNDHLALTAATSYVGVAMAVLNSVDKPSGDLLLLAAWPIDVTGMVQTEMDGDLGVAAVAAGLAEGVKATPEVPEPTDSGPG
jgi:hypothetical protein